MSEAAEASEASAILFLDIDGVLHPVDEQEDKYFAQPNLEQLLRIVEATGARVVLSSTWRLDPTWGPQAEERLAQVSPLLKLLGKTPYFRHEGRAAEIRAWLADHPCSRWVAIDDMPLEEDLPAEHFVRTDAWRGLTVEAASEAISKLGGTPVQPPRRLGSHSRSRSRSSRKSR